MPCHKCDHDLKEHADEYGLVGEGNPCTKCDCKSYGPSMFECSLCGDAFTDTEARRGDDCCKPCADKHGLCVTCGEDAPSGCDFCSECSKLHHSGVTTIAELYQ